MKNSRWLVFILCVIFCYCSKNDNIIPIQIPTINLNSKWIFSDSSMKEMGFYISSKDGTIYVGSTDFCSLAGGRQTYLFALSPDGRKKWSYFTGGQKDYPVIGTEGTVFLSNFYNSLFAIESGGEEKWRFTIEKLPDSPTDMCPSASQFFAVGLDNVVYLTTVSKLYSINSDSSIKWTFSQEHIYDSFGGLPPVITTSGIIYQIWLNSDNKRSEIYSINKDGSTNWYIYIEDLIISGPVVGPNEELYVCSSSYLYSISSEGNINWKLEFENKVNHITFPVVGEDGNIYICYSLSEKDSYLYSINPDGSIKWRIKFNEILDSMASPVIDSDNIIYLVLNNLYAIYPDGTIKWKMEVNLKESPDLPLLMGCDGTLYISVKNYPENYYNLIAVNILSNGPNKIGWPMFGHDPQHSGNQLTQICQDEN